MTGIISITGINFLENIALSCSGGGYRAAMFHLGTMSYLNNLKFKEKPLLENVKFLSTVSGGTFTGMIYALKKQDNWNFVDIFNFLVENVKDLDLLKLGIEKLNPTGIWRNQIKSKNLINAFSEIYDEKFTEGRTFKEFEQMKSHLDAVVFNSTEFNNGINFRFRNLKEGIFGNNYQTIPKNIAEEIKLSDALSCSSSFPGGFEPMIWPKDFDYENSVNLKSYQNTVKDMGIMDGGIYDNQGIESILLQEKINKKRFDLIIISDVCSPFMEPFKAYRKKPLNEIRKFSIEKGLNKIKTTSNFFSFTVIFMLFLFAIIPIFWKYQDNIWTGVFLGFAFLSLILLLLKTLIIRFLNNQIQNFLNVFEKKILKFHILEKLSHLRIEKLSIEKIEPLIFDRISSLTTLLLDVFLKVVRRLNYNVIYKNKKYSYRRVSVILREMTKDDYIKKRNKTKKNKIKQIESDYDNTFGDKIQVLSQEVSNFGTTLWFSKEDTLNQMLDKLICTGQFTTCYNLKKYLKSIINSPGNGFDKLDIEIQNNLKVTYNQCLEDWNEFKADPMGKSKAI